MNSDIYRNKRILLNDRSFYMDALNEPEKCIDKRRWAVEIKNYTGSMDSELSSQTNEKRPQSRVGVRKFEIKDCSKITEDRLLNPQPANLAWTKPPETIDANLSLSTYSAMNYDQCMYGQHYKLPYCPPREVSDAQRYSEDYFSLCDFRSDQKVRNYKCSQSSHKHDYNFHGAHNIHGIANSRQTNIRHYNYPVSDVNENGLSSDFLNYSQPITCKDVKVDALKSLIWDFYSSNSICTGTYRLYEITKFVSFLPFTLVSGLNYFRKYLTKLQKFPLDCDYFVRVYLVCCILSEKFWYDDARRTSDIIKYWDYGIDLVNDLEAIVLEKLDYDLELGRSDLREYLGADLFDSSHKNQHFSELNNYIYKLLESNTYK